MRIPRTFVFLALIFGEIAGFILVGQTIGLLPTLSLVLLGMVAGLFLLRRTGVATLLRVRADVAAGRLPARPLAEGAVLAVAAILIIIPGFITDLIGILLFIPVVRRILWRAFRGRIEIRTVAGASGARESGAIVDLDRGDYGTRPSADSPWRLGRPPA